MKLLQTIGVYVLVALMVFVAYMSWTALDEVRTLQRQNTDAGTVEGEGAQTSTPPTIRERHLELLRDGGYVIFLRHAERVHDLSGVPLLDLASHFEDLDCIHLDIPGHCLTETGKQSAVKFGKFFNELGIDVGAVYSSPICRSVQTAELAFGRVDGLVEELSYLRHNYGDDKTRNYYADKLQSFIRNSFRDGTNVVLSAHHNMLHSINLPDDRLKELGFLVLDRDLNVVAIANPDQFADLVYSIRLTPSRQDPRIPPRDASS